MASTTKHNWEELKNKLKEALKEGKVKPSFTECAKFLGLHPATFRSGLENEWKIKKPNDLLPEIYTEELQTKLGIDVEEGENELKVNYVGERVKTLEQLVSMAKIDTKVWYCEDQKPNYWESPMKIKKGETEHVVVVSLFQLKALFRRIHPVPVMPMIAPIEVIFPKREQASAQKIPKREQASGVLKSLIVPDPQIGFRRRLRSHELDPFHDRRVLDIALQIAKTEKVDSLELIGDMLDLSEFSTRWTPEPEFYWTTMPALIEAAWWIGQFRTPKKRLMEGNHEKRIRDYINQYARAAYGLRPVDELELPASMSIERLIPMEKLGVEYMTGYPDNGYWLNDNVFIEHGDTVRSAPGATAGAVVNKTTYTTIFGHIHRRELVSRRIKTNSGDVVQNAFCPGCACRIDGAVPGSTSQSQWQQGLGMVEYTQTTQNIIPIAVENGSAIYNGKVYTARPLEELDALINKMIEKSLATMKM